jgi:hypothetical protein
LYPAFIHQIGLFQYLFERLSSASPPLNMMSDVQTTTERITQMTSTIV